MSSLVALYISSSTILSNIHLIVSSLAKNPPDIDFTLYLLNYTLFSLILVGTELRSLLCIVFLDDYLVDIHV